MSLNTLLNEIENDTGKETNLTLFTHEFLRQTAQLKLQGEISENVAAKIRKGLKQFQSWLRESLAIVRNKLPGAYKGDFGPEIQQMLMDIDSKAKELSRKENLPPIISKSDWAETQPADDNP